MDFQVLLEVGGAPIPNFSLKERLKLEIIRGPNANPSVSSQKHQRSLLTKEGPFEGSSVI